LTRLSPHRGPFARERRAVRRPPGCDHHHAPHQTALGEEILIVAEPLVRGRPNAAPQAPLASMERLTKRIFDLVGASALFVVSLPAFALVALLIRLDSPGPVFFRQRRRGLHNEFFEMIKFRSMHVAMCDPLAHRLTSRHDPRVTRVGGFLRRWSLDELPQLLNVIQGTMSLVGPRPHPLRAKAGEHLYEEVVPNFALRYRVKPGITGWAQVNGLRGNTDSEGKLVRRFEYDMQYILHWSLWLDVKILLQTPLVIVLGENAY